MFFLRDFHLRDVSRLLMPMLTSFSLMLVAIVFWSWHIITSKKADKGRLILALLLMLLSCTGFHSLYLMY